MKLRYPLIALLAVTVGALALVLTHRVDTYAFHYDNVMGTSLDITVRATSEAAAHAAEAAVLRQIDHDAHILSSYDSQSEFSRWFRTRGEAVPVSPELATVLQDFDTWRVRTGGALDPSAETITRVWNAAASRQVLPSEQALAEAVATVHQTHWRVDARAGTAIHLDAAPIALNSFTKSYIVDRAANAARAVPSVDAVIVNSGGDLVTRGDWTATVGVTDPRHNADNAAPLTRLAIRDGAVATSGGYRRGFDIAGRHYSHIVDPRTGRPTGQVLSATVVAGHGVDAGALATSFCVMSPEESERLAATVPGVEFLLVLSDGSRIRVRRLAPALRSPPYGGSRCRAPSRTCTRPSRGGTGACS